MKQSLFNSLFLKACRGERVPRPPVWLMRQAGRYLPQYRAIRAGVDFLTLCKTPELASRVSLQPVDILGVDAAVIFSDILVLLEAMGLHIHFAKDHGPRIEHPLRSVSDIRRLHPPDIAKDLRYVGEAIRLTSDTLRPRNIPVIGFAGAPFTLACYAIEGETSREFNKTKRFMNEDPKNFALLLAKLADGIALHLQGQIEAGASAVQIFDTWGGILSREDYLLFALPALQRAIDGVRRLGAPVILYVNGSTPHLEAMAETGADVLSVDWRLPLSEVRRRVGRKVALQGNLDPTVLYSNPRVIRQRTRAMFADHPGPGLIANLGHGILPDIPVAHAKAFVKAVQTVQM